MKRKTARGLGAAAVRTEDRADTDAHPLIPNTGAECRCAQLTGGLQLRKPRPDFRIERSDCAMGARQLHCFVRCPQARRTSPCACSSSRTKGRRTRISRSHSTQVLEPTSAFRVPTGIAMASTTSRRQRDRLSSFLRRRQPGHSNAVGHVLVIESHFSPVACR